MSRESLSKWAEVRVHCTLRVQYLLVYKYRTVRYSYSLYSTVRVHSVYYTLRSQSTNLARTERRASHFVVDEPVRGQREQVLLEARRQ